MKKTKYAVYTINDRLNGWKWYCDCENIEEAAAVKNYLEGRLKVWGFLSVPGTQYKIVEETA